MSTEIDELAARIIADPFVAVRRDADPGGLSDVRAAHTIVEELERAGRTKDLVALWQRLSAIRDAHENATNSPVLETCELAGDVIVEALALAPGLDRVEALLTLLAAEGTARLHRVRSRDLIVRGVASRLGYAQPREALLAALGRAADDRARIELLACWMQEVVLTGTALDREPAAKSFHEKLAASEHPLGLFPLTLLESEREAPTYMPMYGTEAIQKAVQALESGPTSTRTIPPPAEQGAPRAALVEDRDVEARLREAVKPWVEGSKGKAEAKVFRLTPAVEGGVGRWLLRSLPLESASSASGGSLDIVRITPDVAWGALFAAASNGGAYSTGIGGAYGRRAAWTSFAALVGAPPPKTRQDIEQIDHEAGEATFLMYRGTDFFFDVAWDIGIAAVRSDGASVAVLAATDTD